MLSKSSKFNPGKSSISAILSLLIGVSAVAPIFSEFPASAQFSPLATDSFSLSNSLVLPAGTAIPVSLDKAKQILVTKEETLPLTLKVAANIRDSQGNLLIPSGSEIVGQIEPSGQGSRFVAQTLIVDSEQWLPLEATSAVITRTAKINKGASAGEILAGTVAGAGAATLIAGLTGDRRIDALEVLAGAAVGTLAGWALPEAGVIGGDSQKVISIDPNRDLTLTLQSDLLLK